MAAQPAARRRRTSTQTPTPGTFNVPQPYGVQVAAKRNRIDVQEGGATDSYQTRAPIDPTANVQITVDPDSQTNLGDGPGVTIVLHLYARQRADPANSHRHRGR